MADSPRRRLAVEAIESFASWDIEKIMAWRADNCITTFLPSKLSPVPMHYRLPSAPRVEAGGGGMPPPLHSPPLN